LGVGFWVGMVCVKLGKCGSKTVNFNSALKQLGFDTKLKNFTNIPKLNKNAKYKNNWKGGVQSQVDLTFYTNDVDNGYKYIFVIVDVYSRRVDAVALKNKEANTIKNAFKTVFNRGFITEIVYSDPGSEFKNAIVEKYLEDLDIDIRFGIPGRKQQLAVVESMNFIINKILRTVLTIQDSKRYNSARERDVPWTTVRKETWTKYLPQVVDIINQNIRDDKPLVEMLEAPVIPDGEDLLQDGDIVYRPIQQPNKSVVSERNKYNKDHFKIGRFRYDISKPMKIWYVSILPGQPVRYLLQSTSPPYRKIKNVSYPRSELLLESEV